mgnify:CR=1 FL=1
MYPIKLLQEVKMEKRVFLIVLDSFGIGAEPDAAAFGDEGTALSIPTNTLMER